MKEILAQISNKEIEDAKKNADELKDSLASFMLASVPQRMIAFEEMTKKSK